MRAGLLKMLKLCPGRLETQAGTTLHVRECCGHHGGRDYSSLGLCLQAEGNQFQHLL
jgi:hypothetical protein